MPSCWAGRTVMPASCESSHEHRIKGQAMPESPHTNYGYDRDFLLRLRNVKKVVSNLAKRNFACIKLTHCLSHYRYGRVGRRIGLCYPRQG